MEVHIRERIDGDRVTLTSDNVRVDLYHDEAVGDWQVIHRIEDGVGTPGGVTGQSDAIEYGLYLLGLIEETDVRPVERC